jgi:hypothetical protein
MRIKQYFPEIAFERVNEHEITIMLKSASVAELNRADYMADYGSDYDTLNVPIFWFSRIKAKVEGRGDGTFLMQRVCHHADQLKATIVNAINPYGRKNLEQLIKWFERFGFEHVEENLVVRRPK